MRKIQALFIIGLISVSLHLSAQDKSKLTLNDAILKQRTELGPERIKGLDWLDANSYMYLKEVDGIDQLVKVDLKKGLETKMVRLEDLNTKMSMYNEALKRLPKFSVKGSNQLVFQIKGRYFLYSIKGENVEEYSNLTEGASDFHFSDDGLNLAYVVKNNLHIAAVGGAQEIVTPDGTDNIVYGKAVSRFEFGISKGIFWSPNGKSVAFYRNDQSEVFEYPLINLTTTPATLNSIKYPMAGAKSEKVSLLVYHLKTKQSVVLATGEGEEYICSINWSPDSKEIILVTLNRDQNHAKYKLYNAENGSFIGNLYEEKDEKYVEPLHSIIFPEKGGQKMIYLSQKDGYMHFYLRYNGVEQQLTKGNWVVKRVLGVSKKDGFIYFEGTGENPTETYIYKVDLNDGSGFKQLSTTKGSHSAKMNSDQSYYIDFYSSVSVPRTIQIVDKQGKLIKNLLNSKNPTVDYKMTTPEISTIKNEDGLALYTRMIKPSDFDPSKKYPVLVYVYGGPHAQMIRNSWRAGAPMWMNYFAEKGYIIYTVDGRGSYNRGKDFEQAIFRNVSEVEMKDQLAGVKYLKSLPYVDTNRLGIHGWSYGGFMTTSLMLKHPGVFKVGVAGGPVTNWKYYEAMYTERYMDDPESNPEGFKKTDLTNYVKGLEGKLLLIHGMSDDVVVPQHNFTLLKKFVEEGIQVDFFPYVGHAHNVRGKDRVHLMEKVLNYIETNLE